MYRLGTSGYNYPEWKGSFYPEKMPSSRMLPFYAERFSTVEINYTFYRMPSEKTIEGWVEATPDGFLFTLKASRRITHHAKLQACEELASLLFQRARGLGEKLGIVLFQLPPYFKKDVETLAGFLDLVPSDIRAAFEFRSKSWLSDDVYELLRSHGAALCVKDDEKFSTPRRDHRRARLLQAQRRGLHRRGHRRVGRHHPCWHARARRRVHLLQARGQGRRPRVRPHDDRRVAGRVALPALQP